MKLKRNQQGSHHILIPMAVIIVATVGFAGWRVYQRHGSGGADKGTSDILNSDASPEEKAIQAGKKLSDGRCEGSGETTFTHLPMDADDFSLLIPYGLMVGDHVTPIDHQYFQPTVFRSAKDTYPVYAMADSQITGIEVHPPENGSNGRIRMVFTVSCTFFYYYDGAHQCGGREYAVVFARQMDKPENANYGAFLDSVCSGVLDGEGRGGGVESYNILIGYSGG